MLVGFGDGANSASSAAVYLRSQWLVLGAGVEAHKVRLVVDKARVTPKAAVKLRKLTPKN